MTKMFKRIWAFVLAIALVVSNISYTPRTVSAATDDTGITFKALQDVIVSDSNGTKVSLEYGVVSEESQGNIVNWLTVGAGQIESYNDLYLKFVWHGDYSNAKVYLDGNEMAGGNANVHLYNATEIHFKTNVALKNNTYHKIRIESQDGSQYATFAMKVGNPVIVPTAPSGFDRVEGESATLVNGGYINADSLGGVKDNTLVSYNLSFDKPASGIMISRSSITDSRGTMKIYLDSTDSEPVATIDMGNTGIDAWENYVDMTAEFATNIPAGEYTVYMLFNTSNGAEHVCNIDYFRFLEAETIDSVSDGYIYNFTDAGRGFVVGFEDENEYEDNTTTTYNVTIGDKTIYDVTESGQTIDLSGLGLVQGQTYNVSIVTKYVKGNKTIYSEPSSRTTFVYNTNGTQNVYKDGIAQIFITTSRSNKTNGVNLYTDTSKAKVNAAITVKTVDGVNVECSDFGTVNVRGNSTALAAKKAYNFKFNSGKDLFNMGKAKKWSLLANIFDKSLIRTQIAMNFLGGLEESHQSGNQFTSKCEPVDLYLDGKYVGTYLLIESVETGDSRVAIDVDYVDDNDDIKDGAVEQYTINGVTYNLNDVLIELANDCKDVPDRVDSEAYYFKTTTLNEWFAINEPERNEDSGYNFRPQEGNKPEFVNNTQTFLNGFESVITSLAYETAEDQFADIEKFIDVESFVDFYITSELFMTKDVNFSSTRFYIEDGKLYAGPLWDLDLSSGNIIDHKGYEDFYAQDFLWFRNLLANSVFETKVRQRYEELQTEITNLFAPGGKIDEAYNEILSSATHNYEDAYTEIRSENGWGYDVIYGTGGFWQGSNAANVGSGNGVYGNNDVHDSYEPYVTDFKTWLQNRNQWLLQQETWNTGAVTSDWEYLSGTKNIQYKSDSENLADAKMESETIAYLGFSSPFAAIVEATLNGEASSLITPSGAAIRINTSMLSVGDHTVVVTDAVGNVATVVLRVLRQGEIVGNLTIKNNLEKKRNVIATWPSVDGATKYAVYADGKLIDTVTDTTYAVDAYKFRTGININGDPTTVGEHTIYIKGLSDEEDASASLTEEDADYYGKFNIYVNYVYGNLTNIWNTTGIESKWNFTICEDTGKGDIKEGADIRVTYHNDMSASVTINDVGVHVDKGEQEWTVKAAIYDAPTGVEIGEKISLSFSVVGPACLIGQQIAIKCVAEEVQEDGAYSPVDPENGYTDIIYTFVASTDEKGNRIAVINYANTITTTKEDYDLLFGLGLLDPFTLNFGDSIELDFSDAVISEVVRNKVDTVTPSSNANNTITVDWTVTDTDDSNDGGTYSYNIYIDGELKTTVTEIKPVDIGNVSEGEHSVTVESVYTNEDTSYVTGSITTKDKIMVEGVKIPDLIISKVEIGQQGYRAGDTVTVTITVTNNGNADIVTANSNNPGGQHTVQGKIYSDIFTNLKLIKYDENGNVISETQPGYGGLALTDDGEGKAVLKAGESATITYSYTLPDDADAVNYKIGAETDCDQKVDESDEDNNRGFTDIKALPKLKDVELSNTGSNIKANWPTYDKADSYIIEYKTADGETKRETVDTNEYIYPSEDVMSNGTVVNVYIVDETGTEILYATGKALADLVIVEIVPENGVIYVGENTDFITTVKNIGTAASDFKEGQDMFAVKLDSVSGYSSYNEVLNPNETANIKVPGYTPETAGNTTLKVIVDEGNRVEESDEVNDHVFVATAVAKQDIAEGSLTLANNGVAVSAKWEDANINEGLTPQKYILSYVVDGETKTVEVGGDVSEYIFPSDVLLDNDSTVTVTGIYEELEGEHQVATDKALANLIVVGMHANGYSYTGEPMSITGTIKNIGTAKATSANAEKKLSLTISGPAGSNVQGNYDIVGDGLAPNATQDLTVTGITIKSEGTYTLTGEANDTGRIPEVTRDDNKNTIDITTVNKGELELVYDETKDKVVATWENASEKVAVGYVLTYVSNGVTQTELLPADVNSFEFELPIDNESTVTIAAKYQDTGDKAFVFADEKALVDLRIEAVQEPSEIYAERPFAMTVTIKNVGTAQVEASSSDESVDYDKWIVTQMKLQDNVTISGDGLLPSNAGLQVGDTLDYEFTNIVVTKEGKYNIVFKVDSPGYLGTEANGHIAESKEDNNEFTKQIDVAKKVLDQEKMDWEPFVYENGENIGEVYPFDIAGGSQNAHIYYKVVDTNIVDEHYYDIFPKSIGYNGAYIVLGIVNTHNLFNFGTNPDTENASMNTKVGFALLPDASDETVKAAINGTLDERYNLKQIAMQNTDYVGEGETIIADSKQPMKTVGTNEFHYYTGDWGLYKYYLIHLENEETGEYYTVAFKVTDDNDEMNSWVKSYSKDGTDPDKLPVYYHDDTCQTTSSIWYDATYDLRFSSMTCYNSNYLAVHISDSVVFGNTYKIEMAYADIDENGAIAKPTEGYKEIQIYNKEGLQTLQLQLPTIFKELPVHSELGGEKDNEYYFMKIYYNTDSDETADEYIEVPIRVRADIPMIEDIQGLTATGRGDSITVMWNNTVTQDVHGYLYDVYIDKNGDGDYEDEGEKVSSDVLAGSYSYDDGIDLANVPSYSIKVVGKWCYSTTDEEHPDAYQQTEKVYQYTLGGEKETETIPGETPTYPDDGTKHQWVLINGENILPITSGDGTKKAEIWYYTDDDMYSVIGYNGHYISLNGNTKYFTGEDSMLFVQDGPQDDTFESKTIHDNFYDGQILINAANMFSTYGDNITEGQTLYYTVKIAGENGNTEKDFYFKVVIKSDDATSTITGTGEWRLISGQNALPVMFGEDALMGTIEYFDYPSLTNTYDMTGYNDYFISVVGSSDNYSGKTTQLYVSQPSQTEILGTANDSTTFTAVADAQNYSEKEIYDKVFRGQIQMRSSTTFEVAYKTTYYLMKVVGESQETGDETVTYIPVRITVNTGDVEIQGFQMNTNNSAGGVAEFSPSFRVVSRASKVMTIDNVLYKVKNYGTVYAFDRDVKADYRQMKIGGSDAVKYYEATNKGTLQNYTSGNGDEKYTNYYALTFKNTSYSFVTLTNEMAFRAYAVLEGATDSEDDDIYVYGNNVYSTSIYDIAENLYQNQKMSTVTAHEFLYDNVLNIVTIDQNRLNISKAMLKALGVTGTGHELYPMVNALYQDLFNYTRCQKPADAAAEADNVYAYSVRGEFRARTDAAEEALLTALNAVQEKDYESIAEWIYNETENYGYAGFYKKVPYEWDNSIDKDFDSE